MSGSLTKSVFKNMAKGNASTEVEQYTSCVTSTYKPIIKNYNWQLSFFLMLN